jgi:hypothetical protein
MPRDRDVYLNPSLKLSHQYIFNPSYGKEATAAGDPDCQAEFEDKYPEHVVGQRKIREHFKIPQTVKVARKPQSLIVQSFYQPFV